MRFLRLNRLFLVAAATLGLAGFSHAQTTILLNNLPSNNEGYGETTSETWRGVTFTTGSYAFEVSTVTMVLKDYLSASDDQPILTINASNGDSPGVSLGSFTAPSSTTSGFQDVIFTPISLVNLDANTTYWLVIAGTSTSDPFYWARNDPSKTPTSEVGATFGHQKINYSGGTSAAWQDGDDGPHSFEIVGVPEPSTYVLIGLGGLAFLARSKALRA